MSPLSTAKPFLLVCLSLSVMISCKKGASTPDSSLATFVTNGQPATTTPVGVPVGSPVSKMIGAAGGVLYSPDSLLKLTIPAGALSANTNISIQPVTNSMPKGIGLAYDLKPNGTKFAVPATISFHYSPDSVDNSFPYFLNIAYQDSSRAWRTDMVNRYFDTTAHTLSLDISHFTIYAYDDGLGVAASPTKIYAGQTSSLFPYETLAQAPNDDGDVITEATGVPGQYIGQWFVNDIPGGNASVGTVTAGAGQAAVYHAPASLDHTITVFVACQFKVNETFVVGKSKATIKNPRKGIKITVKPYEEYDFTIKLYYYDSTLSGFYGEMSNATVPVYTDHCQFDVHLKAKPVNPELTVTSSIQNFAPQVSAPYAAYDVFTWTWIPDPYGVIDVSSAYVDPSEGTPPDSVFEVYLRHANAASPGERSTASGTEVYNYPAQPYGAGVGLPPVIPLDLKRKPPFLDYVVRGGGRAEVFAIVPKE
ncbi:MAG: hypothetical protein Q8927_17705 [Bacteroidota bacterium]|nr:hypothetical protein [Bacteroidota bacterium]MDP4260305.1 hypothetical protein [Bacteroidota bacterium]